MRTRLEAAAYMRSWRAANRQRAREIARAADKRRSRAPDYKAKQRAAYQRLKPLVYVWVAPDGQADYVGRGTMARAVKAGVGVTRKAWWTPQHTLLTMTCDSEWHAMEMEGRWGARYLPRHNREGYRHAGISITQ